MRTATLQRGKAPLPTLPRFRAPIVYGILALGLAALVGRSLWLQRVDNQFLQDQGSARYSREIELPAHRGRIVDRFGEPLAISTPVKSLWAFPASFDATPAALAELARVLGTTPDALTKKIDAADDFTYLAKQLPPEIADRAMALGIKGLHDQNEYRRYYPAGETMSHILGFTGDHDVGQEGIELAQQDWLGGRPGSRRVIVNRRGDAVEDVEAIRAPQAGRDLALSIDTRLQYLAFRELKAAVEANKAKAGGLVILDVASGEILALANWPTYNPNARNKVAREKMRNRALTDVFEPGSTLKPFTIAAALESGKVDAGHGDPDRAGHADDRLGDDPRRAQGRRAHRRAGDPEVVERRRREDRVVAAVGDDVGDVLELGLRDAAEDRAFPARSPAGCARRRSWRPIEQATMAYGHGISVNLVQLARAYTIFATGGELKPVTLFKTSGAVAGRPVLRPEIATEVRRMLEMAVSAGGTAPKAQMPGYRVAGKTGTAHKLDGHGYTDKYVSSFVGFAPASAPRVVVAVMLDEPGTGVYYGGDVAAPVFSTVTGAALRMLGVPFDAPTEAIVLPPAGAVAEEET